MKGVWRGFGCCKKTEKKVKISLIEFCKEGDKENLVTNIDLADQNYRAYQLVEKHLDRVDILKGMIDFQYYYVTYFFQRKMVIGYLLF